MVCKLEDAWWQILGKKARLRGTYVTGWGLSEQCHRLCTAVSFLCGRSSRKEEYFPPDTETF